MRIKTLIAASLMLMSSFVFAQVNINKASTSELITLPGIGEKKAKAIVDYRQSNGQFNTVSDLSNVNGIGDKTVEKLGKEITVGK